MKSRTICEKTISGKHGWWFKDKITGHIPREVFETDVENLTRFCLHCGMVDDTYVHETNKNNYSRRGENE